MMFHVMFSTLQLHREIAVTTGSRNVKVLAPMPEYYSVSVRKIKQNIGKM